MSRHLSRLGKAGLVAKTADGPFALTSLGRLACAVLPSFTVLASRREYFLAHDLSRLPAEFLHRIGELAEHRYLDHFDAVLGMVNEVTEGAAEYVWIMADRPVHLPHRHAHPESVTVRAILPRSFDREAIDLVRQNWPGAKAEVAHHEAVPASLVINERASAVLFPGLDGQIDMNRGLGGDSDGFRTWCQDLFGFVWARGHKALL